MSIVTLESQSDFPKVDLTDDNAAMLELLLLNFETVAVSHESAEAVSFLYKLGHRAISVASAPQIEDEEREAALSFGVSAYEAVACLVRPAFDPSTHNGLDVNLHIVHTGQEIGTRFVDTIDAARDAFITELPRTKMIIGQSAARFYRTSVDYAITGAALARQLEIDATL